MDDYAGSILTIGQVTVNGTDVAGAIEAGGDTDWFSVSLVAGQTYLFRANKTASDGLSDPYLTLYDGSGAYVTHNDDGGGDLNSLISFSAATGGTYFLGVRHYSGSGTGNYTVSAAINDDYANTVATTGTVAVNGGPASGGIETSGDQDWFRVTLNAGVSYQLRLNGATTGGLSDPYLRLYDSGGTLIASDDDSGEGLNSLINYTPASSATYYLGAAGYGSNTGQYTIAAEVPDDYPASDATSGQVTVNGAGLAASIEASGDRDWFAVSLTEGLTYRFRMDGAATGGVSDAFLSLHGTDSVLITYNDDGGGGLNSLITYTATSTGNHYLEARHYGSGTGAYTVSASLLDDFSADTQTTGQAGVNGTPSHGLIESVGDVDWFAVSLGAGVTYQMHANGAATGGLGDPYLYLYSASGVPITSDDDGGDGFNSLITYTPTSAGLFYLGVRGTGSSTGAYEVSVGIPDDHGDTTSTTGQLVVGGGATAGRIEAGGDRDWYRVTLVGGTPYAFRADAAPVNGLPDPYLTLYDAAGGQIANNDDSGGNRNSLITYLPTLSGTYYLGVREFGGGTGEYLVSASVQDDYAATTGTTGLVAASGAPTSGRIEISGDQDWFAVTLTGGVAYQLRADKTDAGGLADPYLTLRDSGGILIASNDDDGGGGNALISHTPAGTGTYYLGVRDFGAGTGQYTVSAAPVVVDDYAAGTATSGGVTVNGPAVSGQIGVAGDHDWFRVTLTGGVTYQLRLSKAASGGLSDPYLRLYNSGGALITANDDGGGNLNSLISHTPSSSGTFYLDAGDYGGGTGAYTVQASSVDDYAAAVTTTGALVVNGAASNGRIEVGGDQDWFQVQLSAGVTYQLRADKAASNGLTDPYLTLYGASGTVIADNDDAGGGGNALLSYTPTGSGTFYVGVRDAAGGSGRYTVHATTADDFTAGTATTGVATLNGSVSGQVDYAGDQDWFRVTLTAGKTYTIRMKGSPSGGGLTLTDPYFQGIYNSAGVLIGGTSNDDYGGGRESQVVFAPTGTGTYYLATGGYANLTGSYQLQVSVQANSDIPGSASTTATLAVGGRRSSTIGANGDQDWFRVSLTSGTTYVIELESDPTGSSALQDPYFRGIYDSDGTTLLPDTSNDDYGSTRNSRVQFTPTKTDVYYLAAGAYGSYTGAYTISLAALANVSDTVGHTTASAGTLTLGASGVNGVIDMARDVDWYRVNLTANQNYVINARGTDSNQGTLRDPSLIGVYNASGALFAGSGNDDGSGSPDAQSAFRPTATGAYYIAVTGQNDQIGTYRLTVEATGSTDIASDTTTRANIAVGGVLNSAIDTAGDADWIRVSLVGGETYQVRLRGSPTGDGTLTDPLIAGIYNAGGQAIPDTANDDFGGSRNAQVTFTAPQNGNYYVAATAFGNNTGTYKLSVVPAAAADTVAPTLGYFSPTDGATGVAVTSNLSLSFNEAVRAGSGDILISGGGQSLSIPVTGNQVSFSGETMSINPASDLLPGADYSVVMGAGVVEDLAGNDFAGISSSTQFNFTTAQGGSGQTGDAWTIMVYVAADNNLEQFAISDLNEMESVNLPSNLNVVTLVDRAPGYDTSNGNWTDSRRGAIVHDANTGTVTSFGNFDNLGELNTGSGATLTGFIDWAATNYAADHYALVVWDHGGGLSGVAWDDSNNGDNMNANELSAAIDGSSVDRFDLIGFDACLMGMVEQAWDLRDLSDVVVASEELIPGDGWAYDRWLGQLAANTSMTSMDLGRSIVTTYGQEYAGQSDITLSALQTSALAALDNALDQFAGDALAAGTSAADWTAMRTAASRSVFFPSDNAGQNYRDLGQFMDEVANRVSSATLRNDAISVANAVDHAVFARSGTVAGATGLSIYMPYGSSAVSSSYTPTNHSFLTSSNWEGFLASL
jgi:hypothetical protein